MNFFKSGFLGVVFLSTFLNADISNFMPTANQQDALATNVIDKQRAALEKEKNEISKYDRTKDLEINASEQLAVRTRLKNGNQNKEFLREKLSLLVQDDHVLREIGQVKTQYQAGIEEHSKLLQSFKEDPDFSKLKIPLKAVYTFEEFEDLGNRTLNSRTRLQDLEKNRIAVSEDLVKLKKARAAFEEEFQEKAKQQEAFSARNSTGNFEPEQQAQLLDLQKKLWQDKKMLADLKVKEAEQRISYIDTQIVMARAQLGVLKSEYERVKRSLYVDAAYLKKTESEVEKKRQESSALRSKLHQEIKNVTSRLDDVKRKESELLADFDIPASQTNLTSYVLEQQPQTANEWSNLCVLELLAFQETVIDVERETKEAQIEAEKAKFRKEEAQVAFVRAWHTLSGSHLGFADSLQTQVKSFETFKAEVQADLALLVEKRMRALNALTELNMKSEIIPTQIQNLRKQKDIFKNKEAFQLCSRQLQNVDELIRQKLSLTAQLVKTYSAGIAALEQTIKLVDHHIGELDTKSFWRRSNQSITWDELKNFFTDVKRFFNDIWNGFSGYIHTITIKKLVSDLWQGISITVLLTLFLRLMIIILFFWLIYTYLPDIQRFVAGSQGYMRSRFRIFLSLLLSFLQEHFVALFLWLLGYIFVTYEIIHHIYIVLLFYLASIPFMLYMVNLFLNYFIQANSRLGFLYISQDYTPRFIVVLKSFCFASIIILFLRSAFLMGNYPASAVPTILLALNYILLQLALMCLISKEWILSLIPQSMPRVHEKVSQYYYVIWGLLITIIVMSNPYVGLGKQVLFIVTRVIIVAFLIPLIFYLYNYMRKISAELFFTYDGSDRVQERFASARAWYGIFVFITFFFFVIATVLIAAHLLGYTIHIAEIKRLLHSELYSPGVDDLGRRIIVTPKELIRMVILLIGAIVTAYVINNFVLRRIFDPLLLTSGIQNTIFTLVRSSILFLALLTGLKAIGLGILGTQIVVLLGAIGYVFKDPLTDFSSYFIILVQRPIKIGDYIMISDDVIGVVRHITPRSVILRKKNSVTLIIPNSQIISHVITNWSYSRTFFALNDMFITIPYLYDPDVVRALLLKTVVANSIILKSPAPIVQLFDYADNGYLFMIRVFITSDKVLEQFEIASDVRLDIMRALRANTIEVASQIRIIKVSNLSKPSEKTGPL